MLWTFNQASWSGASPMHREHWSICTKKCTLNSYSTSQLQTTVISELPQYVHNMCCHGIQNLAYYTLDHLPLRHSQVPSSPPPTQTLTIQDMSVVALRWSVGQSISSHSESSWESNTLFCSLCASVCTTPQPSDPLLRIYCNS